ncbi:MAG: transcriptional repressor [Flavobacterium micromati]|jgi:Fe2+ or Zn2+ uptake regulation protein|nr:transcriptional repressor [Flavobacterium micromati]
MSILARKILTENQLKITQNRVDLLALFLTDSKAYSLLNLEIIFGEKHDRSSIFRCLQTYTKHKIVEKFVDASGVAVYVLQCQNANNTHSHFKCKDCENVQQLPELPAEYLALLGKNKIETTNLLIEGKCEKCQSEKK